jgi:putative transposase
MKRFKSARHVQRFVSIHDPIANLFYLRRDHVTASQYRATRSQAFEDWAEIAGARLAA